MQKRIAILLNPENSALADWVIVSEEGTTEQPVIQGELKNLAPTAKDAQVYVIVPAPDILLLQTQLPKLSRHKLQQALPFALEENLIDDVSQLHFATGPHQVDGLLPVAVVAKSKMQTWVEQMKTVGISPSAMISMTLALPLSEEAWQIYTYHDHKIIRTGKYSGFSADTALFDTMLDAIPNKKNLELIPEMSNSTLLKTIADALPTLYFINLLQGSYPAKRKSSNTKNVWKYAGILASIWLALAFLSNLTSLFILQYQASSINSAISKIYYRNFPHASSTVAPRERMEQKLKEVTGAAQKNNFLSLLATVGNSLSHSTGIRLQNLDYRNGILTLDVSSAAFDNLDALTRDLNANGLTVKQQNSAITGTQVKATLLINAGTS